MSFASDSGYTPSTISAIMSSIMANLNVQFGTNYTDSTFVGSNFYKYFYALAQKVQENEVKTGNIFVKIQDYFALTNEAISRPVGTPPGLIAKLASAGFVASIKPPIVADAGKIYVAVVVDSTAAAYATNKIAIANILLNSIAGGIVSQGTEVTNLTLSNGQSFAYSYNLPNYITPQVRLTITTSANNKIVISSPDVIKATLLANIAANYSIGRNFEPQRYFTNRDAPWASTILLEYSFDGGTTWSSSVYTANYNDLFVVSLANLAIVQV
jgi:hypothetical protein